MAVFQGVFYSKDINKHFNIMIEKKEFKQLVKSSNEVLERLYKELYEMMLLDEKDFDTDRATRIQEEMDLTIDNLCKHYKEYYNRENSFLTMVKQTYK